MNTQRDLTRAALFLAIAFALGGAAPASGQDVDARWLPWLGCWEPVNSSGEADLVCVRPLDQPGSVEIVRVKGTDVVARETVWSDGRRHESTHQTCKGWEEGAFSEDDRRVFLTSSYACEGGVTQEGGGILAMAAPGEWLDVRVAGMGGEHTAWVQRFRVADPALAEAAGFGDLAAEQAWPARTARLLASAGLDVEDVVEASARVPTEAVRALLAEQGSKLELSAAALLRMANAGVSEDVIDVAVAVSYPDRFRLSSEGREVARTALDEGSLRRRWAYQGFMGPAFYDPFYAPWSLRYGYGYDYYGYGYGYNRYGYGWAYGGGYYGYTPVVVDVNRVEPEHGRVIAGRGYSRGSGSGGSASGSGGWAAPSSGGSSAGSSGGGGTSGGTSTGRTAKPRGGG